MISLTITGKIKPYVRTTQRQKFVDPQWAEYEASRNNIVSQAMKQMNDARQVAYQKKLVLRVDILFVVTTRLHGCDKDNQEKAIMDALNGVAYADDRYVNVGWIGRMLGDDYVTYVTVADDFEFDIPVEIEKLISQPPPE